MNPLTARTAKDEQANLTLSCDRANVAVARDAVAGIAGRLGAEVDDVKIAVSEAVANAILHAYRGAERGTIRVSARHERNRLLVTVADDGVGMRPHPGAAGLGVGIPLITMVCDDVRFTSLDSGTTVVMGFEIARHAGR